MIGVYENFPENTHRIEILKSSFSDKKLQEKLVRMLHEINRKPFGFEEIGHQALRKHTVILEVGIAEGRSFNFPFLTICNAKGISLFTSCRTLSVPASS